MQENTTWKDDRTAENKALVHICWPRAWDFKDSWPSVTINSAEQKWAKSASDITIDAHHKIGQEIKDIINLKSYCIRYGSTHVLGFSFIGTILVGKGSLGPLFLGVNWCWHEENVRMSDSLTPDDLPLLCRPITQQWQIPHASSNQARCLTSFSPSQIKSQSAYWNKLLRSCDTFMDRI